MSKIRQTQDYLSENNFVRVGFDGHDDQFIDAFWDWGTQDYKSKYIENEELYIITMKYLMDSKVEFINYPLKN